ncbi:hypothetical protein TNIN_494031, partial [Trichonephila inaurata madagascariensis]
MNVTGCFILILLLQYKKVSSYLEQELQESVNKAMQCIHRDPPKDPVLALSPKRFTQLVTMLRKTSDPPVCDKTRQYPPFQLEDKNSWTFCIFGYCSEGDCGTSSGREISEVDLWISSILVRGSERVLPLKNALVTRIFFRCASFQRYSIGLRSANEYWYDEGRKNYYEPPPSGYYQGTGQQPGEPYIGPGYNIPLQEQKSSMQSVQLPVLQPFLSSVQQQQQNLAQQQQQFAQQQQYSGQQMQNQYLAQQQQYPGQQMQNQHLA